jgi:hypothetical protein
VIEPLPISPDVRFLLFSLQPQCWCRLFEQSRRVQPTNKPATCTHIAIQHTFACLERTHSRVARKEVERARRISGNAKYTQFIACWHLDCFVGQGRKRHCSPDCRSVSLRCLAKAQQGLFHCVLHRINNLMTFTRYFQFPKKRLLTVGSG